MAQELALQQKLGYVDPAAVAAAESVKAMVQARFIMAMQKPRDFDQARDAILTACRRPNFAEKVEFSKKQGKKFDQASRTWVDNFVKGPTIRFAEVALREWGNCDTITQVVYEDEDIKRIKISVLDLQTNAGHGKEITIHKTVERKDAEGREVLSDRQNSYGKKVYIVRATDEEVENKANALISKVIRNEGLRLIPGDVIDESLEAARETLRNRDKGDPDGAKKKILDAFSSLGIKPAELKRFLGHGTDILSPKETEDLRGIYRAIKDGEATWADYTSSKDEDDTGKKPPEIDPAAVEEFDRLVTEQPSVVGVTMDAVEKYVSEIAKVNKQSIEAVKAQAGTAENFPTFWQSFLAWNEKQGKKGPGRPKNATKTDPQPEAPAEGEKAVTGGTIGQEPPRALIIETHSAILKAQEATAISVMDAYEALGIGQDIPLNELTEVDGQRILGWYKSR